MKKSSDNIQRTAASGTLATIHCDYVRGIAQTFDRDLSAFRADGVICIVQQGVPDVHEIESALHSDVPAMKEGIDRGHRNIPHLIIRLESTEMYRDILR